MRNHYPGRHAGHHSSDHSAHHSHHRVSHNTRHLASKHHHKKHYGPFVQVGVIFGIVLLGVVGFWQQQFIRDQVKLYGYTAPQAVEDLADQTEMSSQARRMFYVNHPALLDKSTFNTACSNRGEHSIVLGCYHPVDRGIYIFHVSDERLDGVDQVTAAHEMLHAGYDRLSGSERKRIDNLLQDYYDTELTDQRIKSVIDAYRKSEPNDLKNEMHSIFATEISKLPPELEQYYSQYFEDRSVVVGFASRYQAEFTTRQNQVASYDAELATMKTKIESNTLALETQESQIKVYRKNMDGLRSSGDIAGYNNNVPLYNQKIDTYNSLIVSTKSLISRYNQLVETRNQLAGQVTDLAHSIDSTFKEQTTQ